MHHYLEQKRIVEHQKSRCRKNIEYHQKMVILQSLASLFFVAGGIYYGQKRSIVAPLVAFPSASYTCSKLATNETKRRFWKERLKDLSKD